MTRTERVGMWGLVAGLVVLGYGVSLRMDTLERSVTRLAAPSSTSTSSPPSTTTTSPLAAEVQTLQRQVLQLQANRGLSGPEVRALVETLLPGETCLEPPCTTTTAVEAGPTVPRASPPLPPTTEQQRRRR